jgi:hypothetical protein
MHFLCVCEINTQRVQRERERDAADWGERERMKALRERTVWVLN